jgi:hypothetical protein
MPPAFLVEDTAKTLEKLEREDDPVTFTRTYPDLTDFRIAGYTATWRRGRPM